MTTTLDALAHALAATDELLKYTPRNIETPAADGAWGRFCRLSHRAYAAARDNVPERSEADLNEAFRLSDTLQPPLDAAGFRQLRQYRTTLARLLADLRASNRPADLLRAAVVVERFIVSRGTLKTAVRDGRLTSYRAPDAADNSPHLLSEAAVAAIWPPRAG